MFFLLACVAPDEPVVDPVVDVTVETGRESEPLDSDSFDSDPVDSEPLDSEDDLNCSGIEHWDVGIEDLEDLEDLEGIVRIEADLFIQDVDGAVDLRSLRCLEVVTGRLYISRNPQLESLDGLRSLREVGETLYISENEALTEIFLPSLEMVDIHVYVKNMPNLQTASLPVLTDADYLTFDVPVQSLSVPVLESSSISLDDSLLQDLSGFPSLRDGKLQLFGARALTSLAGPPDDAALDVLYIRDAPGVFELDMPALDTSSLTLMGLGIADLTGIHISEGAKVRFDEMPSLVSLEGWDAAEVATLRIADAPLLESLDGIEGVVVSSADFSGNGPLDLSPLGGIAALDLTDQTVSGQVQGGTFGSIEATRAAGSLSWPATEGTKIDVDEGSIDLDFPTLALLDTLDVQDATITSLSLSALAEVSSVELTGLDHIESIDLGALATTDTVEISAAATSLDLGSLSSVDDVDLDMPNLTSLDLGSLRRTIRVDLTGCDALGDLSGLALVRLEELRLTELASLASLDGLDDLVEVSDTLVLKSLDSLTTLDGLESLETTGELVVTRNPLLTSVEGLSGLTEVTDRLLFSKNELLVEIEGLDLLTTVGGDLTIDDNDVLSSLDGLYAVTSVGDTLEITDNPELATTDAEALRDAIGTDNIGSVSISGNGS